MQLPIHSNLGLASENSAGDFPLTANNPPAPLSIRRVTNRGIQAPIPDRVVLAISLAIQIPLALFFGHYYDDRIFLAAGYLVAHGQNPYQARDLSAVFHSPVFQGITTIGYPPPWALVLGVLYRIASAISTNFWILNFAIKLPIIAANIGLAYMTGAMLARLGAGENVCRRARVFLLLNPFLFYFGTAWGQFDAVVAALALASLLLLDCRKPAWCGLVLALAVSFKPTAVPLFLVLIFYWIGKSRWMAVRFSVLFAAGILLFCILPFPLFGWDPAPILANWNFHFTVAGGMSPMAVYTLLANSTRLEGGWWILGWLWIPALAVGTTILRNRLRSLEDVLQGCAGIMLIFFLTRSWLSEPNLILLLPLAIILASTGAISSRALTAVWILPFVFTALNNSFPQLLFPLMEGSMQKLMQSGAEYRSIQLAAQICIIVVWQVALWRIAARCLSRKREPQENDGNRTSLV